MPVQGGVPRLVVVYGSEGFGEHALPVFFARCDKLAAKPGNLTASSGEFQFHGGPAPAGTADLRDDLTKIE